MRLPFVRGLRGVAAPVALLAVLAAASASGAESDLVPPVAQLFAWNAKAPVAAAPASCAAQTAPLPLADARRRAALARIAEQMQAEPGRAVVLNGRGYAYPVARDAADELRRVVMEARRQRAAAAR